MKSNPRGIARLWAASLIAACALLIACGSDDDASNLPSETGLADVLTDSATFVDTSRPTRPNGSFAGAPQRTLVTRLWLAETALDRPACDGERCGLVVLAHGFGGSTARFDAIARRLAAAGYIVAAPAFPLTNENAPGGHFTAFGDVVSQPADVSFVIDEVLALDADPSSILHDRIDERHIAVLGHSLGGATAVAATRSDCCRDDRIGAVALLAPASFIVAGTFGGPVATAGPPTLTIVGTEDPLVTPASVASFVTTIEPPKAYVELQGGDHVFIIEATDAHLDPLLERTAAMTVAFLDQSFAGADDVERVAADLRSEGHTVDLD